MSLTSPFPEKKKTQLPTNIKKRIEMVKSTLFSKVLWNRLEVRVNLPAWRPIH